MDPHRRRRATAIPDDAGRLGRRGVRQGGRDDPGRFLRPPARRCDARSARLGGHVRRHTDVHDRAARGDHDTGRAGGRSRRTGARVAARRRDRRPARQPPDAAVHVGRVVRASRRRGHHVATPTTNSVASPVRSAVRPTRSTTASTPRIEPRCDECSPAWSLRARAATTPAGGSASPTWPVFPITSVATFVNRRLLTSDRDRSHASPRWRSPTRCCFARGRDCVAGSTRIERGCASCAVCRPPRRRGRRRVRRGRPVSGARLAVVGELAVAHEDALTALEHRFLAESLDHSAAQEREAQRRLEDKVRQNKRLRRSLVGIVAVLVVAIATGAIAVVQRNRADRQQRVAVAQRLIADQQKTIAQSEKASAVTAASQAQQAADQARDAKTASELTTLASRSLSLRSSQRDLAALLAVEAWQRSPDANVEVGALRNLHLRPGVPGLPPPRRVAIWSDHPGHNEDAHHHLRCHRRLRTSRGRRRHGRVRGAARSVGRHSGPGRQPCDQ